MAILNYPMRVGVESVLPSAEDWWGTIYGCWFGKYFTAQHSAAALKEVGAEFTLFYDSLSPRKPEAARRITELCRELQMPFLFNNTYGDIYGPWLESTGRAQYRQEDVVRAAETGLFRGIIWDEVEHRQLHHYDCGQDAPYFLDARRLSVREAYEQLVAAVTQCVDLYAGWGAQSIGEYVFPSMFHLFARAGIHPAPKVLKESFNPIMLAMAMGAARQYDREFWVVADLWGVVPFWGSLFTGPHEGAPGHGPDEYLSSLLLAYWLGADTLYTEGLYNLIVPVTTTAEEWEELRAHPFHHRGVDNPLVMDYRKKGYVMTVYGKLHRWFVQEYLPSHPRPYTFRDLRPEVAILALPDSAWSKRGAAGHWVSDGVLFGPGGPTKEARHEAIFDLFHLLTHGATPRSGITFHNEPYISRRAAVAGQIEAAGDPTQYPYEDLHTGFCPLHNVVVYDHLAAEALLEDVPLLVCTGEFLSPETEGAVLRCVERGAKCLALAHLLPSLQAGSAGPFPREIVAGRGRYLLVEAFEGEAVATFLRPHLGPKDAVRYRFGDHTVTLTPTGGDERRLCAELVETR